MIRKIIISTPSTRQKNPSSDSTRSLLSSQDSFYLKNQYNNTLLTTCTIYYPRNY